MKSWKSILFLLPLAFASTLLAGGEFRLSHRTFENTRLGPVLAQAAYMQTYEYHIQDPVFEKEFPLLDLSREINQKATGSQPEINLNSIENLSEIYRKSIGN